jgi:hypothetical protein
MDIYVRYIFETVHLCFAATTRVLRNLQRKRISTGIIACLGEPEGKALQLQISKYFERTDCAFAT